MLDKIEERLAEIERRLSVLEKDSHPPVDNTTAIRNSIAAILRTAADEASND